VTPAVSVVLTVYNRRDVVMRAIASVLAQQAALELIVVDDASEDGSADIVATLRDARIRLIVAPSNLGPSGARNLGIAAARAPVVAFLDSDDAYLPNRLPVALAALDRDPGLVCAISPARRVGRGAPRDGALPAARLGPATFAWAMTAFLAPAETSGLTVRRDAAAKVGGFCERLRLSEDREFLIRLAGEGGCQLLQDAAWEKWWTPDSLSNRWASNGPGLLAYLRARPEYAARYPGLCAYLAIRVLAKDLAHRQWRAFGRDYRAFRAAGAIGPDPVETLRAHRRVSRYRRAIATAAALESLRPPERI
jgi:glycosyltransferase involved in cell wall biosynthesis